jgi:hypothetical protein
LKVFSALFCSYFTLLETMIRNQMDLSITLWN